MCFLSLSLAVDEYEIEEDVGHDAEPEPVSLATMLNAGDDYYGYDENYWKDPQHIFSHKNIQNLAFKLNGQWTS